MFSITHIFYYHIYTHQECDGKDNATAVPAAKRRRRGEDNFSELQRRLKTTNATSPALTRGAFKVASAAASAAAEDAPAPPAEDAPAAVEEASAAAEDAPAPPAEDAPAAVEEASAGGADASSAVVQTKGHPLSPAAKLTTPQRTPKRTTGKDDSPHRSPHWKERAQPANNPLFIVRQVRHLARHHDIRALEALAATAFKRLGPPKKSYASQVPPWRTKNKARGLLPWGATRKTNKEDGTVTIHLKPCAIPQLCRHTVLKSLDEYWRDVGIVPTQAGEGLNRAMNNPEYDPDTHSAGSRKGHTRFQIVLVPMEPPLGEARNFLLPFLLCLAANYCNNLDPKVEEGTMAANAILGFFREHRVKLQLLTNIKNRISRLANRKFLSSCSHGLYNWVREGDFDTRLAFLRALGDPGGIQFPVEGEPILAVGQMVLAMSFQVVSALLLVSSGKGSCGKNSYGFFPYGKAASYSTDAFCCVHTSNFAVSLAEMYPFVFHDKPKWTRMFKVCSHPMTGLWPWGQLQRHLQFGKNLRETRKDLFLNYQDEDGHFHGPEPDAHIPKRVPRRRALAKALDEHDDDLAMDCGFAV